jgi:hypothetical protein
MCFIELVDFNENMLAAKAPVKAKASRRGTKKKATGTAAPEAEATDETSKEE